MIICTCKYIIHFSGMTDYIRKFQEISFISEESVGSKININITILQDAKVTEGLEVFYGRLTVLATHVIAVVILHEAEIYIMDDNSKKKFL